MTLLMRIEQILDTCKRIGVEMSYDGFGANTHAEKAEAERDSFRTRLEQSEQRSKENLAANVHLLDTAEKFRVRTEAAEKERDSLRAHLAKAEERLETIDVGCGNCGGLPHTKTCKLINPYGLLIRAEAAEAKCEKLKQQIRDQGGEPCA